MAHYPDPRKFTVSRPFIQGDAVAEGATDWVIYLRVRRYLIRPHLTLRSPVFLI
jgi:hypothetical protein